MHSCEKAQQNIIDSIRLNQQFPNYVFSDGWKHHMFFDSDRLFCGDSIKWIRRLMLHENSNKICLCDLEDMKTNQIETMRYVCVDKNCTPEDYLGILKGNDIASGLLYSVGKCAIASDGGNWVIYCERGVEIAVIAVRNASTIESLSDLFLDINAFPIKYAIEQKISYGFTERILSLEWKEALCQNYTT